jgi:FkbM family methyltransferase
MRIRSLARRALEVGLRALPASTRDRLLAQFIIRASDDAKFGHGVPTMRGLLQHVHRNGFRPNTIIDIGAHLGEWAKIAALVFPSAELILIDGNPENEVHIRDALRSVDSACHYHIALLGPSERGEVTFFQHGAGSSVLEELTSFGQRTIRLPMTTLDSLVGEHGVRAPILMKLDVQGFELEVLRGGHKLLNSAEVLILEVALLPYNKDAPLLAEVIAFMDGAGFAAYDFCGQFRRQTDEALFQTDVVFVTKGSELRRTRRFWLREAPRSGA